MDQKTSTPEDQRRARQRERVIFDIGNRIPGTDGAGCFLCKWIYEDLTLNPKMTGYPFDSNGAALFPRASKIDHLKLEGFYLPA